jgi:DNA-binding NtrC family response regulator
MEGMRLLYATIIPGSLGISFFSPLFFTLSLHYPVQRKINNKYTILVYGTAFVLSVLMALMFPREYLVDRTLLSSMFVNFSLRKLPLVFILLYFLVTCYSVGLLILTTRNFLLASRAKIIPYERNTIYLLTTVGIPMALILITVEVINFFFIIPFPGISFLFFAVTAFLVILVFRFHLVDLRRFVNGIVFYPALIAILVLIYIYAVLSNQHRIAQVLMLRPSIALVLEVFVIYLVVIPIKLPPLRERKCDVLPLFDYFIGKKEKRYIVTPDAKLRLMSYSWPGNVRELRNVLERSVLFAESDDIVRDVIFDTESYGAFENSMHTAVDEVPERGRISCASNRRYSKRIKRSWRGSLWKNYSLKRRKYIGLLPVLGNGQTPAAGADQGPRRRYDHLQRGERVSADTTPPYVSFPRRAMHVRQETACGALSPMVLWYTWIIHMDKKASVLVIDDEKAILNYLELLLRDNDCLVEKANSGEQALQKIAAGNYDLVIVDLMLDEYSGIDILKNACQQDDRPEVILMTGHGSIPSAVEAIKEGAFDYVTTPFDSKRMIITVRQALERKRLRNEVEVLRKKVSETNDAGTIIGQSFEMRKLLETAEMVAKIDSTVLMQGESGTGKELIARAIHSKSRRRGRQFVPVNCGALPEALLESELFGYKKGAFTGAVHDHMGLFEEAGGGTLFLDEIGDMPLSLQVKLLRVLQNGEVRRIGDNRAMVIDARVITATNRNLDLLVREGKFREDLFYRLNVIPLTVPPLRERKEDIPALLITYLKIYSERFKRDVKGFSQEAVEFLIGYEWPGNVRELTNLVERTVALVSSSEISMYDISKFLHLGKSTEPDDPGIKSLDLETACKHAERGTILKALKKHAQNQTLASRELGISRTSLWRKMKELGIIAGG